MSLNSSSYRAQDVPHVFPGLEDRRGAEVDDLQGAFDVVLDEHEVFGLEIATLDSRRYRCTMCFE